MFKPTTNKIKCSGDRFIPRRRNNNHNLFHFQECSSMERLTEKLNTASSAEGESFLNVAKEENLLKTYKSLLTETLVPNHKNNILTFSSPKKTKKSSKREETVMWPVNARTKPLITRPNIILDLPDIQFDIQGENIMDWSKKGYMATVHYNKIFVWHENWEHSIAFESRATIGRCLKWDLNGEYLLVSSSRSWISRLSPNSFPDICNFVQCHCKGTCRVGAMEFTVNGKFITACNRHKVCLFDTSLNYKLLEYKICSSEIVNKIVSSCFGNYFVTNSNQFISIWDTKSFNTLYCIRIMHEPNVLKTFAWHPWKEALLVIGYSSRLLLWNVFKKAVQYVHKIRKGAVHCASFNPRSAELVVTYYCTGLHNMENGDNFIMVLKDFNTTVDQVRLHKAAVLCLLWNADGTKLASCGNDENICLWDFFGDLKNGGKFVNTENRKCYDLNSFKTLDLFGTTIR